jgi:hypothetical protein
MTARARFHPIHALLALTFSMLLALAFSSPAFAQDVDEDAGQQEPVEETDGDLGDESVEGDDAPVDATEDGAAPVEAAEDGFGDEGFADDGNAGEQVDAPAGGVEAGFGGLAGGGDPLLTVFFVGSMAAIAGVAGLVWWRRVSETA